jgi:thiamine biosynthesis protein ThiC
VKNEFSISEIKIKLKEFIPYMCKNDDLDSKAFSRVAKREISQNIACSLHMTSVLSMQAHEVKSEERKATVLSKGGLLLADKPRGER